MAIVGTISAENGTLTSTLSDSDLLNPTRNGSYSDDYQLTDVTTGQIITAKLTSDDIDSYLQLIDADTGEMVTEDDNSSSNNINSQLRFKALEGVNYIVRVSSYRKGEEGTYQLTTRSDAPPTPVGTISAANGSVTGSLSNEDSYDPTDYRNYYIDDYQLTDAIPGEVVTLQMNAINLNGRIQLIDADTEKIIKEKSAYGQQTVDLSFVAVTDKNYKVRVSSANEGQTGSYQLNATSTAMNLADLAITESSAPAEITSGEEVAVTWTVANLGDADTTSTSWYDAIYLSRNTTFDPDKDSFLAFVNKSPVVKGDSQSFSRNIAISGYALERANEINNNTNPLEGDWYLLFVTDAFDDQLERDETNNVVAHQIQVNATDLAITNVEAPNSASVGDPISLSWTVKNSGDISAFGYWGDEIYLSDDEYFSGDDEYLEYGEREDYTVPLAAGESYTISLETALGNTKTGSRYLLFKTDTYEDLGETDETNNVIAVPIEINGVDVNLDIDATAPTTAALGESIAVSWTVNNSGLQNTNSGWYDHIYISNDEYFDSSDTYVYGQYKSNNSSLASQNNYTVERNITIPNSAKTGSSYLLFVADTYNYQYETNETDNIKAIPLKIKAPNLNISNVISPSQGYTESSINVSWTVENIGDLAINNKYWADSIYLSKDNNYDSGDIELSNQYSNSSGVLLKERDSYSNSNTINIPDVEAGNYYLLFYTDQAQSIKELDEADNVKAEAIEIKSSDVDLSIIDTTAPTNTKINDTIPISWTVENLGSTSATNYVIDEVYLSDDEYLDDDDTYIVEEWISDHDFFPLMPGENYTISRDITLPNTESGSKYLIYKVDSYNNQKETDETNNIVASPINLNDVDANLTITGTAPASAGVEDSIDVSWTVNNIGSDSANADWGDGIYLSNDEYFDDNDVFITSNWRGNNTPLVGSDSYTAEQNVSLPRTKTGLQYLLFVADYNNRQSETNEIDNVSAVPLEIKAPDLTIEATAPDKINANSRIYTSSTVKNIGSFKTNASYWFDQVYFSTDETYDSNDKPLTSNYVDRSTNPLAVGDSYSNYYGLTVPNVEPGNYYLLYQTDRSNRQGETDETNNISAVPIEIAPSPNLTFTDVSVPKQGYAGNYINVSWTVSNLGEGKALNNSWYDFVYLSKDEKYDSNDTYLTYKQKDLITSLTPGSSYTTNSNIAIPDTNPGNYYLLFYTDRDQSQGESNETDNITAVAIELFQSDIDLAVDNITAPSNVKPGQAISGSWTVRNNGSTPINGKYWYDSQHQSWKLLFNILYK